MQHKKWLSAYVRTKLTLLFSLKFFLSNSISVVSISRPRNIRKVSNNDSIMKSKSLKTKFCLKKHSRRFLKVSSTNLTTKKALTIHNYLIPIKWLFSKVRKTFYLLIIKYKKIYTILQFFVTQKTNTLISTFKPSKGVTIKIKIENFSYKL